MKKQILFIAMMVLYTLSASGQLLVDSLGNIGVKAGDSIVKSTLSINSIGDETYDVYIHSDKTNGMFINNQKDNYSGTSFGLRVLNTSNHRTYTNAYGIHSEVSNSTNGSFIEGSMYGVYGKASYGFLNFGIYGYLPTANNGYGAAVCGTVYNSVPYMSGQYAGYFDGNVFISGDIYNSSGIYSVTPPSSDIVETTYLNEETSINALGKNSNNDVLSKLSRVETVRYSVKNSRLSADSASIATIGQKTGADNIKTQYGLDVKTLQTEFPALVKTYNDTLVAIDYAGLIPLLLQSIKELQAKVATLESGNGNIAVEYTPVKPIGTTELSSSNIETKIVASLSQNNPNPFSEATTIAFTLPESVKEAMLCIYDMNGTQLEQIAIAERGASSVKIEGYKFSAGMYLYSLIADGTVIDTKRMVLTK